VLSSGETAEITTKEDQMRIFLCSVTLALILAGCGKTPDVVVISRVMQKEANVSAAIPGEFGGTAPSMGELYWVEGKVKNTGTEEVTKVSVTFRCTDGNNKRLFVAEVDRIPAGGTVAFRTDKFPSPLQMSILEGEPEIKIGER
jgi:hypothetical protein